MLEKITILFEKGCVLNAVATCVFIPNNNLGRESFEMFYIDIELFESQIELSWSHFGLQGYPLRLSYFWNNALVAEVVDGAFA